MSKISKDYGKLLDRIANILTEARNKAVCEINKTQVLAYWAIGREIVEFEQKGKIRAKYGAELLKRLSADMIDKFGRGFSRSNLQNMRLLYVTYSKCQTVSGKSLKAEKHQTLSVKFEPLVSWSHYCELLKIEDPLARSFYEHEAIQSNWSVRELKRQINSMLFERITLSKDTKTVMKMAKRGQIIEKAEDAIKDPYVLEFLNLKEEVSYTETQLEQALIDKLQYFLLELGKGFSFVARQKRITVANRHYYVDLVFYNRLLRCFILVDLKSGELDHADIGQMNFYLNYYKENEMTGNENDPIGLILCAKKDDIFAKYVLGGLSNRIFASKYKLALPSEQEISRKLAPIKRLMFEPKKLHQKPKSKKLQKAEQPTPPRAK